MMTSINITYYDDDDKCQSDIIKMSKLNRPIDLSG